MAKRRPFRDVIGRLPWPTLPGSPPTNMGTMQPRRSRGRTALLAALSCSILAGAIASPALASGRVLPATRLAEPPRIDGWLQDAGWADAARVDGFTQQRPRAGDAATEDTDVWLAYDGEALYVAFHCHEPPQGSILARALGRDAGLEQDDYFLLVLDSYLDRQNGYFFQTNPNGVRRDGLFRDEGEQQNVDWDGAWRVATRVVDDGWQGEIAIPWSTLRFPSANAVEMGINFERQRRAVNETSHWAPVERQFSVFRVAGAGRLEGLADIRPGRNILLRPYGLVREERGSLRPTPEDPAFGQDEWNTGGELGVDAKLGLSSNVTLDLTLNPDFAQVEVDDQLVNLTRFPLFYPEKRDFFLEKRDFFSFGSPMNRPFFSRRIGLGPAGQPAPIRYGARLTGKVGRTELGVLDMEQGEGGGLPVQHFSVLRVSQDFGTRSRLGFIGVRRDARDLLDAIGVDEAGDDAPEVVANTVVGLDADLRPLDGLIVALYGARVSQDGLGADEHTWGTRWRWSMPQGALTWIHESIGEDYAPAAGFVPRNDADIDVISGAWTPEINGRWIRSSDSHFQAQWVSNRHGPFETRYFHIHPVAVGHGGGSFGLFVDHSFERLLDPFPLGPQLAFDAGAYEFTQWGVNASTNPSRVLSGRGHAVFGEFFDGTRNSVELGLSWRSSPNWSAGLEAVLDRIEREDAGQQLDSEILRLRLGWALSNALTLRLFTQYNSAQELWLSQFRLHYLFGDESDLYVVLTDGRDDRSGNFAPRRSELTSKLAWSLRL